MALLMVLGIFSFRRLPIDQFPNVDIPFVTVQTIYPGASAEQVAYPTIAARPRTSILEIKRCVYEGIELPMDEALRFEQQAFNRTMRSDDASRLMKAYLQSARPLNEQ